MENKFLKNPKKKYIALTIMFIPIIVFIGEILSFSLFSVKKRIAPTRFDNYFYHSRIYDFISGSDRYTATKKDIENENGYINKHGLIKTVFISNQDVQKDIKGVLITGNSVAVGYPMHYIGRYQDSFVNKLESKIRKIDESIDIINLSYYGMNSWQENIELSRYFNSESNHKDLPSDISLIASIGGIQDFWSFIDLLYRNNEDMDDYSYASGLLKDDLSLNYFKDSFKAFRGNINSGFKIFIISLTNNIIRNSNMYRLVNGFFTAIKRTNDIDSGDVLLVDKNSISQIISDKIGISPSEYYRRKDIAVKSVARNMKSMQSLNSKGKFLFVYLPTRFGFTPNQNNIDNRVKYKSKLNVSDLYFLEKDYKNSLIDYLSIEGIKVINISSTAEDNWFYDESHYSDIGHEEISNLISPIFLNTLKGSY